MYPPQNAYLAILFSLSVSSSAMDSNFLFDTQKAIQIVAKMEKTICTHISIFFSIPEIEKDILTNRISIHKYCNVPVYSVPLNLYIEWQ